MFFWCFIEENVKLYFPWNLMKAIFFFFPEIKILHFNPLQLYCSRFTAFCDRTPFADEIKIETISSWALGCKTASQQAPSKANLSHPSIPAGIYSPVLFQHLRPAYRRRAEEKQGEFSWKGPATIIYCNCRSWCFIPENSNTGLTATSASPSDAGQPSGREQSGFWLLRDKIFW